MNAFAIMFVVGVFASVSSAPLKAETIACTGPTGLPKTGMTSPYCHNGRMGFAATEYAAISTAKNMPRLRAIDFAKREAEQKARAALARFLNDSNMVRVTIQSDTMLDSSEKQAWMALVSDTQIETVRARLAAGVGVLAVEEHDGAVHVTVATSPDMKDIASSVSNYSADRNGRPSAEKSGAGGASEASPFSIVPKNTSNW